MLLIQIHILVHEVQEVITVRASRVSQVNDRYVIAVLLGDVSVVTHDVALGIGGEPRHSRSAGILDTRVQPKGSLTDTCCTDHKSVNVAGVYHRSSVSGTSHHDALRQRLVVIACGCLSFGCLLTPTLRIKRHVLVDLLYLCLGRPPSRAMLTVAHGFGFDSVQTVDVGQQGHTAKHGEHDSGDDYKEQGISCHELPPPFLT